MLIYSDEGPLRVPKRVGHAKVNSQHNSKDFLELLTQPNRLHVPAEISNQLMFLFSRVSYSLWRAYLLGLRPTAPPQKGGHAKVNSQHNSKDFLKLLTQPN